MPFTLARLGAPLIALAFLAAAPHAAHAQAEASDGTVAPDGATVPDSSTLRVFVDRCPCRLDYVRTEIPFVNYVRDRTEADVYVLFTDGHTGSGGRSYTIEFLGADRFAGRVDTMRLATPQGATDDERRATIVRYLKLGLIPFLSQTRAVNRLDVDYTGPANAAAANAPPPRDPWNYWVFSTGLSGSGSSEQSSKFVAGNSSFSADRTTAQWHLRFYGRGNYAERRFDFSDGSKLTSYTNSYYASAFVAQSRGPHWSLGGTASLNSSTQQNQRDALRLAPAVEYSLFPYAEFMRRQLTASYAVGATATSYYDVTIYGKTRETLFDQSLRVSYDLTQPWGNFALSVSGSQYLHDLSKYAVTTSADGSFRLFRGFSLYFAGNASRVNNQLYLPVGAASEQDVLLELRQLQTSYRLSGRMGVSYTFGSIFNNVVNPRLGH